MVARLSLYAEGSTDPLKELDLYSSMMKSAKNHSKSLKEFQSNKPVIEDFKSGLKLELIPLNIAGAEETTPS